MGHLRAVGAGAGLGRDAVRREVRREELRGPVVDGAVVHVGPGGRGPVFQNRYAEYRSTGT